MHIEIVNEFSKNWTKYEGTEHTQEHEENSVGLLGNVCTLTWQ